MPDSEITSETLDQIDSLPRAVWWTTNHEGKILVSVGGGLRLIGLTRDATAGRHVSDFGEATEERWKRAMSGESGLVRESGTWHAAVRHLYVVLWGPYYQGSEIAGMAVLAIDVTSLEQSAIQEIQRTLQGLQPVMTRLAAAEIENLQAATLRASEQIEDRKRERYRQDQAATRWWHTLQGTGRWVATHLGTELRLLALALAMGLAAYLGVLETLLEWLRGSGGP